MPFDAPQPAVTFRERVGLHVFQQHFELLCYLVYLEMLLNPLLEEQNDETLLAQRLQASGVQRFAVQRVRTASMLDPQLPSAQAQVALPELWARLRELCIAKVISALERFL